MKNINRIILSILILTLLSNSDNRDIFIPPLDIPLNLSANFGELRPDHFHSGLDFKTEGVTGQKVRAVEDGYVYRISIGPTGFGKALYLRHGNGLSTVYGHLNSFIPEIENFIKDEQYRREKFQVDLFPDKEQFAYNKGDLIAFSGNSGSSMGPHLHFEVRRSSNENPVDPLKYFDIQDNIKPVIDRVVLYPISANSTVNGYDQKVKFKLIGEKGKYTISPPNAVRVKGGIGIGVSTWDFLNNNWNKCGARSVEMKLDGKPIYQHIIDEFSFSESRYINSFIDYPEQVESNTYIQKTFLEPNNRLSIYQLSDNRGIIRLYDNELHNVELVISDFSGNNSRVSFQIINDTGSFYADNRHEVSRIIPFNEEVEYNRHDIMITFPRDCFYDTLFFNYRKSPADSSLYSDVHYIHDKYSPVHISFSLALKPFSVPDSIHRKLCLVNLDNETMTYAGGSWENGFVKGKVRTLGKYAISADTTKPTIKPINFSHRGDVRGREELKLQIDDDFSGIGDYVVTIDGKWQLFEYDPKNRVLTYNPDKVRINQGVIHQLDALVTDNMGNITTLSMEFVW